jgi:hypothetical protein
MSWTPYRNVFKQINHEAERELKRDAAREGALRIDRIGLDLLHDGIAEVVAARFDVDEHALPRDCEFDMFALHEEALREDDERLHEEALREPLMADWEVAILTGKPQEECATIAWSSLAYDAEMEARRQEERWRWQAALEASEDDDECWDASAEVWPPPATMADVEENHDYFSPRLLQPWLHHHHAALSEAGGVHKYVAFMSQLAGALVLCAVVVIARLNQPPAHLDIIQSPNEPITPERGGAPCPH